MKQSSGCNTDPNLAHLPVVMKHISVQKLFKLSHNRNDHSKLLGNVVGFVLPLPYLRAHKLPGKLFAGWGPVHYKFELQFSHIGSWISRATTFSCWGWTVFQKWTFKEGMQHQRGGVRFLYYEWLHHPLRLWISCTEVLRKGRAAMCVFQVFNTLSW